MKTTHTNQISQFQFFNVDFIGSACPNVDGFDPAEMPALRAEAKVIAQTMLSLASYAECVQQAAYFRTKGTIEQALKIEAHAQQLYANLPAWAQW